jgi:hypothetical protein
LVVRGQREGVEGGLVLRLEDADRFPFGSIPNEETARILRYQEVSIPGKLHVLQLELMPGQSVKNLACLYTP